MRKEISKNKKNEDFNDAVKVIGTIAVGTAVIYGASKLSSWFFSGKNSKTLSQKGWDLFRQAETAFQNSRFIEAERYARQCLNSFPNNSDINNLLAAILHYQNKDLDDAISLSQNAILWAPNKHAQGYYYGTLSDIYYLKGEWENAIESGERHLSILKEHQEQPFPPTLWSIWKIAICHLELRNYLEALRYYEDALCMQPEGSNRFKILVGMARSKNFLKRYNSAISYYKDALEELDNSQTIPEEVKSSEACFILNDLGVLHFKLEEKESSIRFYREAISKYQQYPPPYTNLASYFAEKGDISKMRYFLEEAIKVMDSNVHKNLINHVVNGKYFRGNTQCYQVLINLFVANRLITKERSHLLLNTNVENQDFYISNKTKQNLKLLISKNEMRKAIDELMKLTFKKERKYNYVIELSARFEKVHREKNLGLISNEQENLQRNNIKSALIDIIDKLTD